MFKYVFAFLAAIGLAVLAASYQAPPLLTFGVFVVGLIIFVRAMK